MVRPAPRFRIMPRLSLLVAAALLLPLPAAATPTPARLIVAPAEPMVTMAGLEFMGPSRFSTVAHCLAIAGAVAELITDDQYETMAACLADHT